MRSVSQTKSASRTRSWASGSRAWASKPAEITIRSGAKASSAGSSVSRHAARKAAPSAPGGRVALRMLPATPRSSRVAGAGVAAAIGGWRRRRWSGRPRTQAWVPLPWWTSKSRIATRPIAVRRAGRGGRRSRRWRRGRSPSAVLGSAWWPGGRVAQKARRASPAHTASTAAHRGAGGALARPRRCAWFMAVSASSCTRSRGPGRMPRIADT